VDANIASYLLTWQHVDRSPIVYFFAKKPSSKSLGTCFTCHPHFFMSSPSYLSLSPMVNLQQGNVARVRPRRRWQASSVPIAATTQSLLFMPRGRLGLVEHWVITVAVNASAPRGCSSMCCFHVGLLGHAHVSSSSGQGQRGNLLVALHHRHRLCSPSF
jgi:hypothetical protein